MSTTERPTPARSLGHRASRSARRDAGRARRQDVPLEAHAELPAPRADRDALAILRGQDVTRVQELVPIRYGRMSPTPFTFYRGAAAVMAADLATGARTDLEAQLCGDAHLSNFGAFAAPDRSIVLDVNDFDETTRGPFEWDVKRLAASMVVAARCNGMSSTDACRAAESSLRGYRTAIVRASETDPLDLWYHRMELDDLGRFATRKKDKKRLAKAQAKAARKNRLRALDKLTDIVDGRRVIVPSPPIVVPVPADRLVHELERVVALLEGYRSTLSADRQTLLDRYGLVDIAMKVVGVGSVGTRCLIALFETGEGEPIFLQLKEAGQSVLEPYVGPSPFDHAGQRVVEGQRIMQSASDVFLGWSTWEGDDGRVEFYLRQLWDGKLSAVVEQMGPRRLDSYGALCGMLLARAHARSGDGSMIAGYVDDDEFERSFVAFAEAYADRTVDDHAQLAEAIADGRVEVVRDL